MINRKKGNSLLEVPSDYTLIDLETTGFSSRFDDIIEVGLIKMRNDEEVDRYQTLVKPPKPIPTIVEYVTGIRNDMVINAPKFEDIGRDVWNFLLGEIVIGHNVSFDINFLYDNFERTFKLTFQNDFVDTMRLARHLVPDIKSRNRGNYGLDYLCKHFRVSDICDDESRHRAIGDCLYTDKIFKCLKALMKGAHIDLTEITKRSKNLSCVLKTLKSDGSTHDESHVFYGKCCVFTGKLELFARKDAAQIVVNIGGYCENRVTKKTNFLIVGDMDYKSVLEGYESNKLKKARELIQEGHQDLTIIPESAFYDLVHSYLSDE